MLNKIFMIAEAQGGSKLQGPLPNNPAGRQAQRNRLNSRMTAKQQNEGFIKASAGTPNDRRLKLQPLQRDTTNARNRPNQNRTGNRNPMNKRAKAKK